MQLILEVLRTLLEPVLSEFCPLSTARIAWGNADHRTTVRLAYPPIDAQQEAQKHLPDRLVKATIREKTADLILDSWRQWRSIDY